jgi:hypothetical protein
VSQDTLRLRKTAEAVKSIDSFSIEKLPDGDMISRDNHAMVRIQEPEPDEPDPDDDEDAVRVPASWHKGQLLNVRNRGEFYVVTLLGEEDEPPLKPAPNGALRFTNTALCQDWISKWYAREHHDPRAR